MSPDLGRSALDCTTCREMKLADPRLRDPALLEHLRQCPPCARFAGRIDAFEERLCSTAEIPVPDGLAERILLARPRAGPLRRLYERWLDALGGGHSVWLGPTLGALTASLALGVAVLVVYQRSEAVDPFARSLIAHVVSEPGVLESNDAVPHRDVVEALARYGGRLQGPLQVRHLGLCFLDGERIDHLLVETPHGMATLLLVRGTAVDQGPQGDSGFTVAIAPLRDASMGIVTRTVHDAGEVRQFLEERIKVEG